jgi:hypothetical protein
VVRVIASTHALPGPDHTRPLPADKTEHADPVLASDSPHTLQHLHGRPGPLLTTGE